MKYTGFDIGGTKCAVCLGDVENGEIKITDKKSFPTECGLSPYEIIDRMCAIAKEMGVGERVGISCGSPLDSKKGIIQSPPNLPGWDNIEIVKYVKEKLGVDAVLQNDANACALAEWKFGAGKGTENMIFLTFGTGFGAGLILNGRLYSGTNDNAGEVGHIRLAKEGPAGYGKEGSAEGFCSGGGIAKLGKAYAKEQLKSGKTVSFCKGINEIENISAKLIAECANKGFEDAIKIYKLCGEKLGEALSVLIDLLNPEKIVIGSIFQRSENLLRKEMQKVIDRETLPFTNAVCKVVPAELKENLGDYAAISVAVK